MKRVLYVDDEDINLKLFKMSFMKDFEVYTALSGEDGLQLMEEVDGIEVVVSDLKMPGMDGLQFIKEVKRIWPEKVCMLLTGYIESDVILEGFNRELLFRYLTKPWKKVELQDNIDDAFKRYVSP